MTRPDEIAEKNRRAWNEIADVRAQRWAEKYPNEMLRSGGTISAAARAAAGDVTGKTLLHLQCATGEDTLSWAALGAVATGVDISDKQIAHAERRARDAGLPARFVAADVYNLPEDVGAFDVVFTGGGALVWMPDIVRWGEVVAAHTRRGGIVIVEDEHPIGQTLAVDDGAIRLTYDYFQRGRLDPPDVGWGHFDSKGIGSEQKHEFVWPLGDVVTSLVRAGLSISSLQEFPTAPDQRYRFGDSYDDARTIPGSFLLVARG